MPLLASTGMKATMLLRRRIVYSETSFAELVLWQLPKPLPGSWHAFKYRLAFVVKGECVIRYDNEAGKGDHRHAQGREVSFRFESPEHLIQAFLRDIARYRDEDRDA